MALVDLLAAVDRLPASASRDCPVCQTVDALSTERRRQIANELANRGAFKAALDAARAELREATTHGAAVRAALKESFPARGWDVETAQKYRAALIDLDPLLGERAFEALVLDLRPIALACEVVETRLTEVANQILTARKCLESGRFFEVDELCRAIQQLNAATGEARTMISSFDRNRPAHFEVIRAAVQRRSRTAAWQDLVELAKSVDDLSAERTRSRISIRLRSELLQAKSEVESARRRVLDVHFSAMSDEILRWWDLLRPSEPVNFSGLRRRAEGLRYVDLKARLEHDSSLPGHERDATGLLSESQLNALGLAIFFARCLRYGPSLVVLDDPIAAYDSEHRLTFAQSVLPALLEAGAQVILTTFDKMVSRDIQDFHGLGDFSAYIVENNRQTGATSISKGVDSLHFKILDAEQFLRTCTANQLEEATTKIRRCAERLCKTIVINARRAAGEVATHADLTGNLELAALIALAAPHIPANDDKGKLRSAATTLNPGAHDAVPPGLTSLSVTMGNLKAIHRKYVAPNIEHLREST